MTKSERTCHSCTYSREIKKAFRPKEPRENQCGCVKSKLFAQVVKPTDKCRYWQSVNDIKESSR
jgi:hypothetical protein